MNITIIGANGQIGKLLTKRLAGQPEHNVTAVIRKKEQAATLEEYGAKTALADLEGSVDQLSDVIKGADAVVFAAGSGGSTGPDKTLLIDLDGAVKSVEATEKAGVSRFVLISALFADDRTQWPDEMKPYYVAKHYADRMLEASSLDYTIIRPGALLDDAATGMVQISEKLGKSGSITRADVAEVIANVLNNKHTYHKAYDVIAGDQSITEAIQSLK